MASLGDPGATTTMAVDRTPGVTSWSFGSMFLCMQDASQTAVVQEIKPHAEVGDGFAVDGIGIHDFLFTSEDTPIISVEGYPPDLRAPLLDPIDFEVEVPCPAAQVGTRVVELIIGLRATSDEGGGWLGVDVGYTVGQGNYVLAIKNNLLICGVAVSEYCTIPGRASPQ